MVAPISLRFEASEDEPPVYVGNRWGPLGHRLGEKGSQEYDDIVEEVVH